MDHLVFQPGGFRQYSISQFIQGKGVSRYKCAHFPANAPGLSCSPIMSTVPCLSKTLWEPEGKDNAGYVQGACCRLCRLTQSQRFICCEHSMVSQLFRGDSAIPDLSLSVQLKTGYFDILLLRKLDIAFPSP